MGGNDYIDLLTLQTMIKESVSDAFKRALELIEELPEDKYVDFLARSAAKAAVTGGEELVFNERDKASVAAKACQAANALLKERGLPGGLTVSGATRALSIFTSRLWNASRNTNWGRSGIACER